MRHYLIVTTAIFVLIIAAHIARAWAEGWHPLTEADFLLTSLIALGMAAWSIILLRRLPAGS